ARDRPAVELRHHHVEQHQVGSLLARELETLAPVRGLEHVDARGDQVHPAEQTDRTLVVDDEHPPRGAGGRYRVATVRRFGSRAPTIAGAETPKTPPADGPPSAERSRANRMGDLGSHSAGRILWCRPACEQRPALDFPA